MAGLSTRIHAWKSVRPALAEAKMRSAQETLTPPSTEE